MRGFPLLMAALMLTSGLGFLALTAPSASALVDGDYVYINSGGNAYVTGYLGAGGSITVPSTLGGLPVTRIDNYAFGNNTNVTSVTLQSGVTVVDTCAFYRASALITASLPSTLTGIGQGAFEQCTHLTSISIPDSTTVIGSYAFSRCYALTSVSVGTGLSNIQTYAFNLCLTLSSISFYGLTAPGTVGVNWTNGCSASLLGHAYAASDFPSPGNTWNSLLMGAVIPAWEAPVIENITATYEMAGGTTHSMDIYPLIYEMNATYDMYLIEFDTYTGTENVTLTIDGWTYLSSSPWCDSIAWASPYLNLTGVLSPVTYRVYCSFPVNRSCEVYLAMYTSSTGTGLPWETFRVKYCDGATYNASSASDLTAPNMYLPYNNYYTVGVLDFFGNLITTQTFATSSSLVYVSIPLNVYSFKVANLQEDFTKIRIYYENSTTPITYFCAPNEPVETMLRPGVYHVGVTMYDNASALATQWFNVTVDDAEFLLIQGYTISMVISDIEGVYALQTIISSLVTPDIVAVSWNLPGVPDDEIIYIHPWSVVAATVEVNGSGTSGTLYAPYPATAGSTYVLSEDRLFLSGNWSTDLWLNYTNGTVYHVSTVLPSYLTLDGQNLTVEATANITWTRHTEWREETLFYYTYYTATKKYQVTLDLNNSMATGYDWTDINWLVGLPEGRTIDPASIRVYDNDNDVYLTAGQHYDVSTTGIKMNFAWLNSSAARHFTISMYDRNTTAIDAIAYTDQYDSVTYSGQPYYLATAAWTNDKGTQYQGRVTIKLDFDNGYQRYIDPSTVHIRDVTAGRLLGSSEWAMSEGLVIVTYADVDAGEAQTYEVYFLLDMAESGQFDIMGESFIQGISWFSLLLAFCLVIFVVSWWFRAWFGVISGTIGFAMLFIAWFLLGGA